MKRAADKESVIFTTYALKEIVRNAKGVINVLCDNSLITAFGYGKKKVGLGVVREIAHDFGMQRPLYVRWRLKFLIVTLIVIGAYLGCNETEVSVGGKPDLPNMAIKIPPRAQTEPSADKVQVPVDEKFFVHRLVEKGDTLAKLIKEVYGHVDSKMIRLVKKANPHIDNENLIIEGVA